MSLMPARKLCETALHLSGYEIYMAMFGPPSYWQFFLQTSYPSIFHELNMTKIRSWTTVDTVLDGSVTLLDTLQDACGIIPVPFLKPAVALVLGLLTAVKVSDLQTTQVALTKNWHSKPVQTTMICRQWQTQQGSSYCLLLRHVEMWSLLIHSKKR